MLTAELGGMTQSARHLGTTQSAVSQTVAKLESTLGVRLFDRAMRPLALTPAGKMLLREGSQLLQSASKLAREVREGPLRAADCVTIAMAESLANHLTAPLLHEMGSRAERWQVRSGISMLQHHEFVARKLDMLVTGSSQLEEMEGVVHYPVMDEGFIVIAPTGHLAAGGSLESLSRRPLIRYSLLSAMGQRIERQIRRLKLNLPNKIEVDSTLQQISAVASGVGWSISTPLCLAAHLDLIPALDVFPLPRGSFRRRIQIVARRGEFGNLAEELAAFSSRTLRTGNLRTLNETLPFINDVLEWPDSIN